MIDLSGLIQPLRHVCTANMPQWQKYAVQDKSGKVYSFSKIARAVYTFCHLSVEVSKVVKNLKIELQFFVVSFNLFFGYMVMCVFLCGVRYFLRYTDSTMPVSLKISCFSLINFVTCTVSTRAHVWFLREHLTIHK